jgi:hypothetical protein
MESLAGLEHRQGLLEGFLVFGDTKDWQLALLFLFFFVVTRQKTTQLYSNLKNR